MVSKAAEDVSTQSARTSDPLVAKTRTQISKNNRVNGNIISENKTINGKNEKKFKILIVRGIKYEMDLKAKTLRQVVTNTSKRQPMTSISTNSTRMLRLDIGGLTYRCSTGRPGLFIASTGAQRIRQLRKRAIKSSINRILLAKKCVSKSNANKKHCIFFCRFGRCNRGADCPYIHDKDKIAVCSRYIRGTCKSNDCPFSHCVAPDRMPVCQYYLEGRCSSDSCPYRHVKVNSDAQICVDFNRGYCPNGDQCKSKHLFVVKPKVKTKSKTKPKALKKSIKANIQTQCSNSECLPEFIPFSCNNDNTESDPIYVDNNSQQISQTLETVINTNNKINNNINNNNRINRKEKYFWLESDDENSNCFSGTNDYTDEESIVCRPPIRIVPNFLF